jgi:hypothetical protein
VFFGGAILKENNNFINKEKNMFLSFLLMQHARLDGIALISFDLATLRLTFTRLVK